MDVPNLIATASLILAAFVYAVVLSYRLGRAELRTETTANQMSQLDQEIKKTYATKESVNQHIQSIDKRLESIQKFIDRATRNPQ